MHPRRLLRTEGLSILVGSLAAFFVLDGPLWLLAVLALAPDLSMVGYLRGPRIGSLTYNLAHTYAVPLALAGAGAWLREPPVVQAAAVWIGHIGADRALGYGLKYETGFGDTHLGEPPADPFAE